MQNDIDPHLNEKNLSRQEKQIDKETSREPNSNTIWSCFDLQAVVKLPKGQSFNFLLQEKTQDF